METPLLRIADLQLRLHAKDEIKLTLALAEIAERLSYNEDGAYEPEESVAANSAADFIESVKDTFRNILDIEL